MEQSWQIGMAVAAAGVLVTGACYLWRFVARRRRRAETLRRLTEVIHPGTSAKRDLSVARGPRRSAA